MKVNLVLQEVTGASKAYKSDHKHQANRSESPPQSHRLVSFIVASFIVCGIYFLAKRLYILFMRVEIDI